MNSALKYLYHTLINGDSRWYPLLAIHYLTYQCSFRCPYCSNGQGQPYHRLSDDAPSGKDKRLILERVRRHAEHLVLTGGEPLEYLDVDEVLASLPTLRFKTVALNTNGFDLDQHLEGISRSVSTLIVSLDTLNEKKADAWFGKGPGTLHKILSNIELAANAAGRSYDIMISAVATPNNIGDLYEVYRYAADRGFQIAVCPELQGVKPNSKLPDSEEYRQFFAYLIEEKKKGGRIFGSTLYLRYMQQFLRFSCRPFSILVTDPAGNVMYPCLEIGHIAGNILESDDLHGLRGKARQKFGPMPECRDCCYSACALGFSLAIEQPWSEIRPIIHR